MGFTYGGPTGQERVPPLNANSGNITVTLQWGQMQSILSAYESLKSSVYEGLLLDSVRFKPYLTALISGLSVVDGSVVVDTANFEQVMTQSISQNQLNGVVDLIEFTRAMRQSEAFGTLNWDIDDFFVEQVAVLPDLLAGDNKALDFWILQVAQSWQANLIGESGDDLLVGDGRANIINGSFGNDIIWAKGGDDEVYGAFGDHTIRKQLKLSPSKAKQLLTPDVCNWIYTNYEWFFKYFSYSK